MTKPFNIEIPAGGTRGVDYNPSFAVYSVKITNLNGKEQVAAITYDRKSGTVQIVVAEKGV